MSFQSAAERHASWKPALVGLKSRLVMVRALGPSHSELLRVDLTDVPDAQVGDEVVLLGRSGNAAIPLEELADQWRMSTHDLFPAIGKTLPRRYID